MSEATRDEWRVTGEATSVTRHSALPFQILTASIRDLFDLHTLERACFGPDAWDYFELTSILLFGRPVRLKAVIEDRLVGFVMGDPRRGEGLAWIATLGVHPDYQRRGIGEALLSSCEAALSQPQFKLTVRASNTSAIALYEKSGYCRVGVWRRYYAGGEDGIVMEKKR